MTDDFDLGRLLGRREAFGAVAARCSAAEAVNLRQIREEKLYLARAKDWDEFCTSHLHMSKDSANRVIRYLDEFGPTYFEIAQLTRISPAAYRAIAPSIREQALHHNGEAIALIPENTQKVAAAVAELRKSASVPAAAERPKPAPDATDRVLKLERQCGELVAELEEVVDLRKQREQVRAVICSLRSKLNFIEMTL